MKMKTVVSRRGRRVRRVREKRTQESGVRSQEAEASKGLSFLSNCFLLSAPNSPLSALILEAGERKVFIFGWAKACGV